MSISKLAEVHPSAKIGKDVTIGPFCYIGPDVQIGDGCLLYNNVTVDGVTCIGKNNTFYQNTVIGVPPQDLKYKGGRTRTEIGDNNVFRENCTVHRGTEVDIATTVIGSNNLFMVSVHIAHDCIIHDNTIIGNQTQLAGHVEIESGAVISALVGLHHFVTVGKGSYIAGLTPVRRDVPPYVKFSGDPNKVRALNEEGLKRGGFDTETIAGVKKVFKRMFKKNVVITDVLKQMSQEKIECEHIQYLYDFVTRSCQSKYYRYKETLRRDAMEKLTDRKPFEARNDE